MPIIFTGERGTVKIFLQTFNYYRNANHHNDVMRNTFERSNLLLTYMKGPKVQQWAARKGEELTIAVLGDPANNVAPTHNTDNEQLWTQLTLDLRTAYSEYHGAEGAYRAIKNLRQKPGYADDYIVQFENLLNKAGWGCDQHGTIAAFKEGLFKPLLVQCIKRRPKPITLTEWMDVARDEEQSFYQMKFDLAEAKKHRGGRHLEDMAQDASQKGRKPAKDIDPRPYNPMQLDAAKVQRMSDEECQELLKAGKCFGCKQTGHRYWKCPERPMRQGKNRQNTQKL